MLELLLLGVLERTVRRQKNEQVSVTLENHGPAPVVSLAVEDDLAACTAGVQGEGHHVTLDVVLPKANVANHVLNRLVRSAGFLSEG